MKSPDAQVALAAMIAIRWSPVSPDPTMNPPLMFVPGKAGYPDGKAESHVHKRVKRHNEEFLVGIKLGSSVLIG